MKLTDLNKQINEIADAINSGIERALVERIEIIEGRVPSNHEIAKYGEHKFYLKDGKQEFLWKGNVILEFNLRDFYNEKAH